jgi:sec-independent protein translocase protein TatA
MFGTIGGPELLLIFVIALIVFGPKKLPEIGRSLGKMLVEFKKATSDFQQTVEKEIEADKLRSLIENPHIEETKASTPPIEETAKPQEPTVSRETPPAPIEPK